MLRHIPFPKDLDLPLYHRSQHLLQIFCADLHLTLTARAQLRLASPCRARDASTARHACWLVGALSNYEVTTAYLKSTRLLAKIKGTGVLFILLLYPEFSTSPCNPAGSMVRERHLNPPVNMNFLPLALVFKREARKVHTNRRVPNFCVNQSCWIVGRGTNKSLPSQFENNFVG